MQTPGFWATGDCWCPPWVLGGSPSLSQALAACAPIPGV